MDEHGLYTNQNDVKHVFAKTDDGVNGVIRDEPQEHMKMDNGKYFIPIKQDIVLLRAALKYAIDEADMGGSRELPEWIAELGV